MEILLASVTNTDGSISWNVALENEDGLPGNELLVFHCINKPAAVQFARELRILIDTKTID